MPASIATPITVRMHDALLIIVWILEVRAMRCGVSGGIDPISG